MRAASILSRDTGAAGVALLVAAVAAATLATVWIMQNDGYVPCELCLLERNPYYVGVALALTTAAAAAGGAGRIARVGLALLAVLFLVSAGLAAYHAGVEYKLWVGPTGCTGAADAPTSVTDFMKALQSVKVVRCDAPALVVVGLSLAGWNVVVSLLLAALAGWGAGGFGAP